MNKHQLSVISWQLIIGIWLFLGVSTVNAAGVGLRFEPTSVNLNTNATETLKVWMDTGTSQVVGVDLVIKYDNSKINVEDVGSEGVFGGETGKIINNNTGALRLSLSNNYGVYSSGNKAIAWIRIKSLQSIGSSNMSMEFTPGNTADTNVVLAGGQDILGQVGSVSVSVSGIGPTSTNTPGPTAIPTSSLTPGPTVKPGSSPTPTQVISPTHPGKPRNEPKPTKEKDKENNGQVKGESVENSVAEQDKKMINWGLILIGVGVGVLGIGAWLWFRHKEV